MYIFQKNFSAANEGTFLTDSLVTTENVGSVAVPSSGRCGGAVPARPCPCAPPAPWAAAPCDGSASPRSALCCGAPVWC